MATQSNKSKQSSSSTPGTFADIFAEIQRTQSDAMKQADRSRPELVKTIVAAGIDQVDVEFYGSGDSGMIEEVTLKKEGKDVEDSNLRAIIEDWCYTYLTGTNVDWYNNDGGQGEITFDFRTVPYVFKANVDVNFTDSSTAFSAEEVA